MDWIHIKNQYGQYRLIDNRKCGNYNHHYCSCCCIGLPGTPGINGISPHIGENNNWFIGDEDTGISAQGSPGIEGPIGPQGIPGKNGISPHVDENGNWWIGTEDTGIHAEGIQGPQGEQGLQGPQGVQGSQGIQGENGLDGTSVHVLGSYDNYIDFITDHPTGRPGEAWFIDGSLYVWDETTQQWINVGYLRGPQGIQGIQGTQGIQGIQGAQGAQGERGESGIQGAKGDPGDTPYINVNGHWWIGTTDTGILAQGPPGPQGTPGAQGPRGDTGATGATGPAFILDFGSYYRNSSATYNDGDLMVFNITLSQSNFSINTDRTVITLGNHNYHEITIGAQVLNVLSGAPRAQLMINGSPAPAPTQLRLNTVGWTAQTLIYNIPANSQISFRVNNGSVVFAENFSGITSYVTIKSIK